MFRDLQAQVGPVEAKAVWSRIPPSLRGKNKSTSHAYSRLFEAMWVGYVRKARRGQFVSQAELFASAEWVFMQKMGLRAAGSVRRTLHRRWKVFFSDKVNQMAFGLARNVLAKYNLVPATGRLTLEHHKMVYRMVEVLLTHRWQVSGTEVD